MTMNFLLNNIWPFGWNHLLPVIFQNEEHRGKEESPLPSCMFSRPFREPGSPRNAPPVSPWQHWRSLLCYPACRWRWYSQTRASPARRVNVCVGHSQQLRAVTASWGSEGRWPGKEAERKVPGSAAAPACLAGEALMSGPNEHSSHRTLPTQAWWKSNNLLNYISWCFQEEHHSAKSGERFKF